MTTYDGKAQQSYRLGDDGHELMANFTAVITQEVRYDDGMATSSVLTIEGEMPPLEPQDKPRKLEAIEVTAEEFAAMSWPMRKWGVRVIVYPIPGVKDDLRTMIQQTSEPKVTTVYRHTGWVEINKQPVYLHKGGGITRSGNRKDVTVQLPPELSLYDLTCAAEPKDSVLASLALLDVGPLDLTWPLLAATLTPLYGPVDFGVHITGRTGSFKSELASLFQSHYGAGMDARHLPGSWASTGNANECLAFLAANAVFTVDDFIPHGTSWQQRAYQAQADKLFRSQGNQAGRARLTDVSSLQKTMYPRGLILSTGEDTPEGHSVRGRMLIRELAAGTIDPDDLTRCQAMRSLFPGTVAWLAQDLCKIPSDLRPVIEEVRTSQRGTGHGRTPSMLGRLIATAADFLERARANGFLSSATAQMLARSARESILAAGKEQQQFLEDSDPVDAFLNAVRQTVAIGKGHFRQLNGGPPRNATQLGWSAERSIGELPLYKSKGPCIGWVRFAADEMLLDVTAGYPVVIKEAGASVTLGKQTLFKRMRENGTVKRADDARGRNVLRVVCEGSVRQVLCLSLSQVMQWSEVSDGGEPGTDDDADGRADGADAEDEG